MENTDKHVSCSNLLVGSLRARPRSSTAPGCGVQVLIAGASLLISALRSSALFLILVSFMYLHPTHSTNRQRSKRTHKEQVRSHVCLNATSVTVISSPVTVQSLGHDCVVQPCLQKSWDAVYDVNNTTISKSC